MRALYTRIIAVKGGELRKVIITIHILRQVSVTIHALITFGYMYSYNFTII
jgi:hypothetical protein